MRGTGRSPQNSRPALIKVMTETESAILNQLVSLTKMPHQKNK